MFTLASSGCLRDWDFPVPKTWPVKGGVA